MGQAGECSRMNIDERLEKLTGRHEALTQTVELMVHGARERGERIDRELEKLGKELEKLGTLVSGLVSVAEAHGRRLDKFEGNQ